MDRSLCEVLPLRQLLSKFDDYAISDFRLLHQGSNCLLSSGSSPFLDTCEHKYIDGEW